MASFDAVDTTLSAIRKLMPVEVDEDFYMDVFVLMVRRPKIQALMKKCLSLSDVEQRSLRCR